MKGKKPQPPEQVEIRIEDKEKFDATLKALLKLPPMTQKELQAKLRKERAERKRKG